MLFFEEAGAIYICKPTQHNRDWLCILNNSMGGN